MRIVPLVLVDDVRSEVTYFESACKHQKMKNHFGSEFEFKMIAILHERTMDIEQLCRDINEQLLVSHGWIVVIDRNLAGGVVGENVIRRYKQLYPQHSVVFFGYTTDVGTPEFEARWLDDGVSLIAGFLPKSLLFNLGRQLLWVENLRQAARNMPHNLEESYSQMLRQLTNATVKENRAEEGITREASSSIVSLPAMLCDRAAADDSSCLVPMSRRRQSGDSQSSRTFSRALSSRTIDNDEQPDGPLGSLRHVV